jgi:DNA-binding MarR family transcriptional regulator
LNALPARKISKPRPKPPARTAGHDFSAHTPAGEAFTHLVLEVFRLNGRLLSVGDRLVGELGLTSARWQVLGALRSAPRPLTVSQIARTMGLQRQSVQRLVDVMAENRLLDLIDNPGHRRAKHVVLTRRGLETVRSAERLQASWANAVPDGISAKELTQAHRLLREIRHRLVERQERD